MAPQPVFRNDTYVTYTRKCVVFPAHDLEPQVIDMTIRTATVEDPSLTCFFSRTLDLLDTYGSEYRKTRTYELPPTDPDRYMYMLHYNMSPQLPLNRCVARVLDIDLDTTNVGSKLFWRGDVIAMKCEPQSKYSPYIDCHDADTSAIGVLEETLRDAYCRGFLERELSTNEMLWAQFSSRSGWSTVLYATITGYHAVWGSDWRRLEAEFLDHINELKVHSGRRPVLTNSSMTGLFNLPRMASATIPKTLRWFSPSYPTTGPPAFPPELERRIFETCARNYREICLELVLVARRVRYWIDPILYNTVILDDEKLWRDTEPPTVKSALELFVSNIDCKSPEFYSTHVKNLWISGPTHPDALNRILTVCSGVENLVLLPWTLDMTGSPQSTHSLESLSCLRRMTVDLAKLSVLSSPGLSLGHACFSNITHLHLYDDNKDWSTYNGYEHLYSLTHLALVYFQLEQLATVMKLPALEYVVLCSYSSDGFGHPMIDCTFPTEDTEQWGVYVVRVNGLAIADWECGATWGTDFWNIVEAEVARRQAKVIKT